MRSSSSPDQFVPWSELAGVAASDSSLTALVRAEAGQLTGAELVDAIVCAEKGMSLLAAVQADLMAELALPYRAGDPQRLAGRLARRFRVEPDPRASLDSLEAGVSPMLEEAAICLAASEVAAALRIAPVSGSIRVREALELSTDLRPTRDALAAGVIDRGKCRVIMTETTVLTAGQKTWVQNAVLPLAGERSTARLREATARAVMVVDPDGTRRRHEDAVARRDLRLDALPDGMAALRGFLRADHAAGIFQMADLIAQHTDHPDDARSVGARRIDALSDIADQLLTHGRVDLGAWVDPAGRGDEQLAASDAGSATADDRSEQTGVAVHHRDAGHERGMTGLAIDLDAADAPPVNACTGDPTSASAPLDAGEGSVAPHPVENGDHPTGIGSGGRTSTCAPGARVSPPTGGTGFSPPTADRRLSRQGRRPHLTVTLADTTLSGFDDLPGTLNGHGPIPADLARTIARSAASVTALLVDAMTGAPISAGTREYRPRQALRDQVTTLADTCRFPSCRQPSWRCDLDHRTRYDHHHPDAGGPTDADNLDPTCRRHHQLKHATTWTTRRAPGDLATTWTSPTGHTYVDPPRQAACPALWVAPATTGAPSAGIGSGCDNAADTGGSPAQQGPASVVDVEPPPF